MSFGAQNPQLDLVALENRVLEQWRHDDVPRRVREHRAGGTPWIFYEGPPTANGRPGLHHVWARAFKDLFPRFQTMRGHAVPRKGGWDCHGLPVELEVEKALGLSAKDQIEEFGIAEFNQRCRESVQRYVQDWTALTERSGVWIDTADAYWTLDNSYVESVWWLMRQLWDKGLLYEGHRVIPYCGRCGTALSSHEVAQGYKDVEDPSVYVRFPLTEATAPFQGADLLVWTTTPWTLISNVGAAVGADIPYVRIAHTASADAPGNDLVLAAAAAERLFPDAPVIARGTGAELAGARYTRPFTDLGAPISGDPWRVVTADFVSTTDGSGIVHLAPAFGEDDARVGRTENLGVLNPVDKTASFDATVARFAGQFVKSVDRALIDDLRERQLLVQEVPYVHSYPHCWRCGTPLIYWAKTSWFARTSEIRGDLVAQNESVSWYPEHIKHGRFGKWLEGNVDWALSRDRYWGTPLPIWRCEAGHDTCIGSVAELSERYGQPLDDLDLHRPAIDKITFPCGHADCDATATRLEPVLDAWFDSGAMPSAQRHHPFQDADQFAEAFPADFICEAIDQTRGWFYSLLAVNTMVFDQSPYRNVVCLGHIVDEHGQKMSKSRGNIIDPWLIFEEHGADALRWYFFSAGQPWAPRRVFSDGIRESTRQTLLTLWNCVSFFTTYADLDGWTPAPDAITTPPTVDHALDKWILSELSRTITDVTDALEGFDALAATSALARFVDDLSNWYVRRNRARFWKDNDPLAHATLHHSLTVVAQLLAPFCPFLAEEIWQVLTGPIAGAEPSVHLTDWPTVRTPVDDDLAAQVAASRRLVALGRSARTDSAVKVRQPLRRALLLHPGIALSDTIAHEIAVELNVKELEQIDTISGLLSWTAIPNFKALGPRLGKRVNDIKAALAQADGDELHRELTTTGKITIAGEELSADEVELRAVRHKDFALAEDTGWAVALDLELDDDLRSEGLAREVTRALNDLRKDAGLAIADRVTVSLATSDATLHDALNQHAASIAPEVLATTFALVDAIDDPSAVTLSIGEAPLRVAMARVDHP